MEDKENFICLNLKIYQITYQIKFERKRKKNKSGQSSKL